MSEDFDTILDALSFDGVYRVDRDLRILSWNKGAEAVTGFDAMEVVGRLCSDGILQHVTEDGCAVCLADCPLNAAIQAGRICETRVFLHHKNGFRVPVAMRTAPVRDSHGEILGAVAVFRSLSVDDARLQEIQRLKEATMTDHLTGIGNRRYGDIVLANIHGEGWGGSAAIGIALVDIDHFKNVNDTFGHASGDRVLRVVATTLRASLRPRDVICRWGGEEFLAVLPGIDGEQLTRVVERMRHIVASSWLESEGGHRLSVTVSIGAILSASDEGIEESLARADALLYRAKAEGRNRCFVDGNLAARITDLALARQARQAESNR